ncbi:beta-1,3-galactosyltransferase pvg3-like [Carex rostrata]
MSFPLLSKTSSPSTLTFVILSLAIVALVFITISPINPGFLTCSRPISASSDISVSTTDETTSSAVKPEFRMLLGIVTLPEMYERRHLLRNIFALQTYDRTVAQIDIRYVFCNLTDDEQRVFVALEIMRYDDIIILNCKENMNDGKTYAFLSSLPELYGDQAYDFVMKGDDDSYIILDKLVESLRDKPREDMYYGLRIPCDTKNFFPFPPFMEGMGYVLSWDLIQWIATSDLPRKDNIGLEDMWTGRWFNLAGKAKNRFDMAPRFYDYLGNGKKNCFRHEFIPDSILVHRLKKNYQWADTLKYFNVTSKLKPSKFYHIP